jgi:hypothetical protein
MTSKFRVIATWVPPQAAGLILACIATSAAPEPGNVQPDVQ